MFTYKKVSVVFLLLVTVFVSCSEEEPRIIEVEIDKVDQYNTQLELEYNDKISFNIMPITNIIDGTINSITLEKDFSGIISLVGTGGADLKSTIVVTGELTIDGSPQSTNIDLTEVGFGTQQDVSKLILHIDSVSVQTGDRISVVIDENTFIDRDGKVNKEITKEVTIL